MIVTVSNILNDNKSRVLNSWRESLSNTSKEKRLAPQTQGGRFADPAAYHTEHALADALDWLLSGEEPRALPDSLERLCHLKAVQNPVPSSALRFCFELKPIVHKTLGSKKIDTADLRTFEARIDVFTMQMFDCYTKCRDKIGQLKVEEIQRREKTLQRSIDAMQRKFEKELV